MKERRIGVNILALLGGLSMILAMFFPWWSFKLEYTPQTDLYPYLIDGPGSELIGYKRSPQMTVLTVVLIACIVLCLVGSFLEGRKAKIMLGTSGILVLLATWRLLHRISGVAARFDLPIQGQTRGSLGGFAVVEVATWLRPGLYLIIAGGVLVLIAAFLHDKVRIKK